MENDDEINYLDMEDLRTRNREKLILNLERVIQEKNASIAKIEERFAQFITDLVLIV